MDARFLCFACAELPGKSPGQGRCFPVNRWTTLRRAQPGFRPCRSYLLRLPFDSPPVGFECPNGIKCGPSVRGHQTFAPLLITSDSGQPFVHLSHLRAEASKRRTLRIVVLGEEAPVGAPVHPLWLAADVVQDARRPRQAPPDRAGPPDRPVVVSFTLASVGQSVALATREHPATMQDGHPSPTAQSRTAPPNTPPAEPAGCPIQPHRIAHLLPLASVVAAALVQNHDVRFRP